MSSPTLLALAVTATTAVAATTYYVRSQPNISENIRSLLDQFNPFKSKNTNDDFKHDNDKNENIELTQITPANTAPDTDTNISKPSDFIEEIITTLGS